MGRVLGLTLFLLLIATAADVRAQTTGEDLFARGKALFAEGKYPEAYDAYKQAWAHERSYDVAGNLGNVEVKLGRWADAAEHLTYARDHLPPSLDAERKREVLGRISALLADVRARVTEVDLALQPKTAAIVVDGRARTDRAVPEKLWLEPGQHRLEVRADGYEPATRTVQATAGGTQRLQIALKRLAKTTTDTDGDDGPLLALVVTGAVLAAAGIGTGIGLVVAAEGKADDRLALAESLGSTSNACGPGTTRAAECQQIEDLSAEEITLRNIGITSLAAGGAIGIATLVYAVWPRSSEEEAAWAIRPMLGPSQTGLLVQGRF